MQRTLTSLADHEFDIVVIGGGIYGACVAWDASLRGLSVALVDKGDFGHATSANSLKIVHGGLRYLKDGNPRLIRAMIRERMTWMRIAPHLVHPLPCIMPTYRNSNLLLRRPMLRAAVAITDLLGYGCHQTSDPEKHLPNGRAVSRAECLQLLPGLASAEVTGGVIWYDAQIRNTERLLLSIVLAACEAGARVANYVEVTGFLGSHDRVSGVHARDVFTGERFDIRGKVVINCAGAWAGELLKLVSGRPLLPDLHLSKAANLVTRQIIPDIACGLPTTDMVPTRSGLPKRRTRQLFVAPWRQFSLIGTMHEPVKGTGDVSSQPFFTEAQIQSFLDEVNAAYPGACLTLDDVYHVQCGYLPARSASQASGAVSLVRESLVYDHAQQDKVKGLITVVGVKYTTARATAEKAVDLAVQQLDCKADGCRTSRTPVYGGQMDRFGDYLTHAVESSPPASHEVVKHLVYTYGSEYSTIFASIQAHAPFGQPVATSSCTTIAEVLHSIRQEMAVRLSDVLMRRTEIGAAGLPEASAVRLCADWMALECGWNEARRDAEIQSVYAGTSLPKAAARRTYGASEVSLSYARQAV